MKRLTKPLGLLVLGIALCGCNMGMAPSGGSSAEVEANFKKMDAKKQIEIIKSSPASAERKAQLIKEIEDRTGVKDDGNSAVAGGSQSNKAGGG